MPALGGKKNQAPCSNFAISLRRSGQGLALLGPFLSEWWVANQFTRDQAFVPFKSQGQVTNTC